MGERRSLRLLHVVRGQKNRAALGAKSSHHFPELQAALRIESRRRLIEKKNVGIADQGARGGQTLLLTSGELPDARIALLVEAQIADERIGRGSRSVERAEKAERLDDCQLLVERVLKRDSDPLSQSRPCGSTHAKISLPCSAVSFEHFDRASCGAVRSENRTLPPFDEEIYRRPP